MNDAPKLAASTALDYCVEIATGGRVSSLIAFEYEVWKQYKTVAELEEAARKELAALRQQLENQNQYINMLEESSRRMIHAQSSLSLKIKQLTTHVEKLAKLLDSGQFFKESHELNSNGTCFVPSGFWMIELPTGRTHWLDAFKEGGAG